MKTNAFRNSSEPALCRLTLRGSISPAAGSDNPFADWLMDARVVHGPRGGLRVEGRLADQSALYGLLSYIRELGLDLVSVELIQNSQGETNMNKHLVNLICKAAALAMGVAVTVLSILGNLTTATAVLLLGLGLAALSLSSLPGSKTENA